MKCQALLIVSRGENFNEMSNSDFMETYEIHSKVPSARSENQHGYG